MEGREKVVNDEISLNMTMLMSHVSVITLANTEPYTSNESTVQHVNYISIKLLMYACERERTGEDTQRWERAGV